MESSLNFAVINELNITCLLPTPVIIFIHQQLAVMYKLYKINKY